MNEGTPVQENKLMGSFLAWVMTGLRREAIRLSKRRQRRCQRELLILDSTIVGDSGDSQGSDRMIDLLAAPDDTESEAFGNVTMESIMAVLTPAQRKVIEALAVHGLDERTAARSLGISQPTVNRVKRAALRRIRLYLSEGR